MTTKTMVFSSFVLALAALTWTVLADDSKETATPDGLLDRITALEKRAAAAEEETQADRALISMQSKLIAALQEEVKVSRESAAKATADAKAELNGQLKANRKEVYADIASIVSNHDYTESEVGGWGFDASHNHQDRAQEGGYVAGVRNGHHSGTHVGSIRLMPKSLIEKNKQIAAE